MANGGTDNLPLEASEAAILKDLYSQDHAHPESIQIHWIQIDSFSGSLS